MSAWTPSVLQIKISAPSYDSATSQTVPQGGFADMNEEAPLSDIGPIVSFCVPTFTFTVHFYIDTTGGGQDQQSRPWPVIPSPFVSVNMTFVTDQGQTLAPINVSDSNPGYNQIGYPLQPSFSDTFSFSAPSGGGRLDVTLKLEDDASGTSITYTDTITCTTIPCA